MGASAGLRSLAYALCRSWSACRRPMIDYAGDGSYARGPGEIDEGRAVLRGRGPAGPGTVRGRPEADDHRRVPADPLASDALLRPLGLQRLRALPGLQGRRHQGLLPPLRRGALQRLRAERRRPQPGAARQRHRRLADHLRRHRAARQHRPATAGGPALPARGRAVLRQLRRRADRRAPARSGRGLPAAGEGGGVPVGPPPLLLPSGVAGRRRRGHRHHRRPRYRPVDERRVLPVPPGDLRLPRRGRGPGRRAVPAPDRARTSCSPTATRGSGCRWSRSRTSRTSRPSTTAAPRPGRRGWPPRPGGGRRPACGCPARTDARPRLYMQGKDEVGLGRHHYPPRSGRRRGPRRRPRPSWSRRSTPTCGACPASGC